MIVNAPTGDPLNFPGHYVYAYNLPFNSTTTRIEEALRGVGTPSDILIYDVRGSIQSESSSKWTHQSSPINGIFRFESEGDFIKAVRIENKLFGVHCKSADMKPINSRPIYLEPASIKSVLFFSQIQEGVCVEDIIGRLSEELEKAGMPGATVSVREVDRVHPVTDRTAIAAHFPSFFTALAGFHHFRHQPLFASTVAFNRLRSTWGDGGCYVDYPLPKGLVRPS
jgi:hypothetical protein